MFALVTGAAGVLALTQAVVRQVAAADRVDETLAAVGLTRGQRAVAVALPLVVASAVGAGLAVLGAVAVSPLFPLGVARRAEPEPGVLADGWFWPSAPSSWSWWWRSPPSSRRGALPGEPRPRTGCPRGRCGGRSGASPPVVIGVAPGG